MFLFKCIKFLNFIYSVVNEDAGRPSMLNKLALLVSLQAYLENFGLGTEAENTSTVFPIIFATAGTYILSAPAISNSFNAPVELIRPLPIKSNSKINLCPSIFCVDCEDFVIDYVKVYQ